MIRTAEKENCFLVEEIFILCRREGGVSLTDKGKEKLLETLEQSILSFDYDTNVFSIAAFFIDILENADMKFEDMKDARYHLLVSSDLEVSESSRQTLFTKEKVLTYSPISSVVRNKL